MSINETLGMDLRSRRSEWRAHLKRAEIGEADLTIGLAASFTVDPLVPYLGQRTLAFGLKNPAFPLADYNQVVQVCMNPQRSFEGHAPDVVALLWRLEDLVGEIDIAAMETALDSLLRGIRSLRDNFSGMIITSLPPRPRPSAAGLEGFSRLSGLDRLWHRACLETSELSADLRGVYTIDLEQCVSALGEAAAHDGRKSLLYRQPYSEEFHDAAAGRIFRLVEARTRPAKKCLVLDGDNTLWGGIIGEDGVGGIAIGQDFPGSAFRDFQRQVAALKKSGVFIAINSKNNAPDVWEIFDARPEMVLKRSDFSAACINWTPKSENLKAIARQLNIGLDSLVFVDDSSFEVAEVRAQTPEVTVLQAPEDPAELLEVLKRNAYLFDRLDLTDEDTKRVAMVGQESARKEHAKNLTEEEFLASLELTVAIFHPGERDLTRVTQLINKTNQFNLTTKRYTEDAVRELWRSGSAQIYCMTVGDRFGDYGLVGVAIVTREAQTAAFDTLLMSCRVLGRGIETAFISVIVDDQAVRGATETLGIYRPTSKNMMVSDLFARHGFAPDENRRGEENATAWLLTAGGAPAIQPFLKVSRPSGGRA
jgi:FkbH-like protein